ncbi:MAG TPA: divalent metal cation transporter [Candidatus Paceibacterota bacterium]|nr:divalent metal cation transporter [Candidatus Paceibacterota bacterium]
MRKRLLKLLGPGFVTGAADDDPSGIATYSQTGAAFGLSQLWLVLFTYPFMVAVQEMCGRIGLVTGRGLAGVIRAHYSRKALALAVLILLIVNTITIGADLGAMASSLQLVLPIPFFSLLCGITAFCLLLQIFVPYPTYASFLKYFALALLAYVVTALLVTHEWGVVLHSLLVPHIEFSRTYVLNIAAFLGTTISPYLFFWQADEEVEEEVVTRKLRFMGKGVPKIGIKDIRAMRADTMVGMFFSNAISFFIILTVGITIGSGASIDTASDAAAALRPIAGDFAYFIFALGVVGTGLLAVPVLAGSAGYAVAEAMGWKEGLGKRFGQAPGFYLVILLATLFGLFVNVSSIGSMTMLYYAAMLNGVLAPPLMLIIILICNNKKILGSRTNGLLSNLLGITITVIMAVVAVATIWQLFV